MTTRKFYEEIRKELPNIRTEVHRELLRMAFFSSFKDEITGAVIFGAEEIAKIYGTVPSRLFNAGDKLKEFLNLIPQEYWKLVLFNGKEWCKGQYQALLPHEVLNEDGMIEIKTGYKKIGDGKKRQVIFSWPEKIQALLNEELNDVSPKADKVYFVTGKLKNEKVERVFLKDRIEVATNEIELMDSPFAKEIGFYQNTLSTHSFNQIRDNAKEALDVINTLPVHVRDSQIRILGSVLECPKPVYTRSKSGNTPRLFGMGDNITSLKSSVRQVLTRWDEVDIRNCHISIACWLWNVPEMNKFLASGKSIWCELINYLRLPTVAKGTIKKAIYGIIYGQSVKNTILEVDALGFGMGNAFFRHPLIKELSEARNRFYKKAKIGEIIVDAFGTEHVITKDNKLTIMSILANSWEQVFISPIYDVAKTTTDFSIMLNMHDGCSIKWHDNSKKQYWINRINEAFAEKVEEFGINLSIEWKFVEASKIEEIKEEIKIEEAKEIVEEVITYLPAAKVTSTSVSTFNRAYDEILPFGIGSFLTSILGGG